VSGARSRAPSAAGCCAVCPCQWQYGYRTRAGRLRCRTVLGSQAGLTMRALRAPRSPMPSDITTGGRRSLHSHLAAGLVRLRRAPVGPTAFPLPRPRWFGRRGLFQTRGWLWSHSSRTPLQSRPHQFVHQRARGRTLMTWAAHAPQDRLTCGAPRIISAVMAAGRNPPPWIFGSGESIPACHSRAFGISIRRTSAI